MRGVGDSFAGEGTPYNHHKLPTIGYIAAPWSIMNPALNLEAVDPVRMRKQIVMFTDLIQRTAPLSVNDVAGTVPAERFARKIACDFNRESPGDYCLGGKGMKPIPPKTCADVGAE
jgi:hypothetical protein